MKKSTYFRLGQIFNILFSIFNKPPTTALQKTSIFTQATKHLSNQATKPPMKKLLLPILILLTTGISAQQVDCFSGRFDTEVFSSVDTTRDIVYGSNNDYNGQPLTLTMDVYEPSNDTMQQRPLIVWVHGGSFLSGTKDDVDVDSLCVHFAKRGYVCATINYRLGIAFPYNQANATAAVYRATQDMRAAVRFFRKDAASTNQFRINPDIIIGGGSSAGAFTALHLAYLNEVSEIPASIDTNALGNLEGNSGNQGYASNVHAVVDLCGALGDKAYIVPGDIPFAAMHGTNDQVVPYATAVINLLGVFPIMTVDGSYSICNYANTIGVYNEFYTYFGADHVPYYGNIAYMDTTVRFVSNFLYRFLGCTPSDPNPLPNTLTTSISQNNSKENISIFPQPAQNDLYIDFGNEFVNELSLMNSLGQEVLHLRNQSGVVHLSVGDLPAGMYILSSRLGSGVISKSVLVK